MAENVDFYALINSPDVKADRLFKLLDRPVQRFTKQLSEPEDQKAYQTMMGALCDFSKTAEERKQFLVEQLSSDESQAEKMVNIYQTEVRRDFTNFFGENTNQADEFMRKGIQLTCQPFYFNADREERRKMFDELSLNPSSSHRCSVTTLDPPAQHSTHQSNTT